MLPELRVPHSSGELPLRSVRESQSESLLPCSAERRGGGSGGVNSMRKVIYISGPYTAATHSLIHANIMAAREVAIKVWELGAAAECPHLNTFHFEIDAKLSYDEYMEGDFAILKKCDGILMMPTWKASKGANLEHNFAIEHGVPLFYSPDALERWLKRTEAGAAVRQQLPDGDGKDVVTLVKADVQRHEHATTMAHQDYEILLSIAFRLKREMTPACLSTPDVRAEVITDLEDRVQMGEKKYGTRLKTNNGRDVKLDLYQEILDAINYARQEIEQSL